MKTKNYYGKSCKTGIYAIRNDINGKVYIGQTKRSFHSRKTKHLAGLSNNKHFNYRLNNDVRKYGIHNFTFEVLLICDKSECDFYESEYIKKFRSNEPDFGYNISPTLYFKYRRIMRPEVLKQKSECKKRRAYEINGLEYSERGLHKPIKEYAMDGKFIYRYESGREYCALTGSNMTSVSTVLSNRKLYYKGKIIIFENDVLTKTDIELVKRTHSLKHVFLYTTDGSFVGEFESVPSCAEFIGCKDAEIRMCYTGKRSRVRNYIIKLKFENGTT